MEKNNYDALSGIALVGIGATASAYAAVNYDFELSAQLGPALFPVIIGLVLACSGLAIVLQSFLRARALSGPASGRAAVAILVSMAAFAATVDWLGIVLSTVLLTLGVSFADGRLGIVRSILLGVLLAALATLLFDVILGLRLPVVPQI